MKSVVLGTDAGGSNNAQIKALFFPAKVYYGKSAARPSQQKQTPYFH